MHRCVLFHILLTIIANISVRCETTSLFKHPIFPKKGNSSSIAVPEMCYYCFDVLKSHLRGVEPPTGANFTNDAYPVIVTWTSGEEHRLRGSKGTFEALPLHTGLREYAIISGLKDRRFKPITIEEFSLLTVWVSILHHVEKAENYLDWQLGTHGIRMFFVSNGQNKSATYLPEVPTDAGWNKMETIHHLLWQGGYSGAITEDVRRRINLTRYQTDRISVGYDKYLLPDIHGLCNGTNH